MPLMFPFSHVIAISHIVRSSFFFLFPEKKKHFQQKRQIGVSENSTGWMTFNNTSEVKLRLDLSHFVAARFVG